MVLNSEKLYVKHISWETPPKFLLLNYFNIACENMQIKKMKDVFTY